MSKIKEVCWKNGFPSKGVDAKAAHQALERIREVNDGELEPAVVVARVQAANRNVLRGLFEWDNKTASTEYRLAQARSLLRAIHVVYEDAPKVQTRAYELTVEPQKEAKPRKLYRTAEDVLNDPDARAELLKRAMGELVSFQRRFRSLQELAIVFRSIDEALTSIEA